MKKGFALIYVLGLISLIGILTVPVVLIMNNTSEDKELFSTYIEKVNSELTSASESEVQEAINDLKNNKYVKCEEIIITENNQVLLNKCTVEESSKKYCYYNDQIYNCKNKEYKKQYAAIIGGEIPDDPVTPVNPNPEYAAGTLLKIEVGNGITNNFYVLSETKDTVTAIMDKNYGDYSAWISDEDYSNYLENNKIDTTGYTTEQQYNLLMKIGPITAKKQLPTSIEWSNANDIRLPYVIELISQTEWYKGLSNKQQKDWRNEYRKRTQSTWDNMTGNTNEECRSSIVAYEKANGLDSILVPTWLDINLHTTGDNFEYSNGAQKYAYWTQDIVIDDPTAAWYIRYNNGFMLFDDIKRGGGRGVRPVITINKSHIVEKLNAPVYVDGERR